jgi:hypothetical protein
MARSEGPENSRFQLRYFRLFHLASVPLQFRSTGIKRDKKINIFSSGLVEIE